MYDRIDYAQTMIRRAFHGHVDGLNYRRGVEKSGMFDLYDVPECDYCGRDAAYAQVSDANLEFRCARCVDSFDVYGVRVSGREGVK